MSVADGIARFRQSQMHAVTHARADRNDPVAIQTHKYKSAWGLDGKLCSLLVAWLCGEACACTVEVCVPECLCVYKLGNLQRHLFIVDAAFLCEAIGHADAQLRGFVPQKGVAVTRQWHVYVPDQQR